jgi:hypothetical protein
MLPSAHLACAMAKFMSHYIENKIVTNIIGVVDGSSSESVLILHSNQIRFTQWINAQFNRCITKSNPFLQLWCWFYATPT